MAGELPDLVAHWTARLGIDPGRVPYRCALEMGFPEALEPWPIFRPSDSSKN